MNRTPGLFFIISLLVYWIGLLPIVKGANDLPYSSTTYLKNLLELPSAWSSLNGPFGQNQLSTLWSWPSNLLYGIGANLGLSVGFLVVFLGILPILIIGFWGMHKYSGLFIESEIGRGFASFFFVVNSYILLVVDGGQLLWGLAYALFPYCLYRFEKKLQNNSYRLSFQDFVGPIVMSFCDLRAVYLLGLLLFIRFIYQTLFLNKQNFYLFVRFLIIYGAIFAGLLILLHSYWIVPLLLSGSAVVPSNLVLSPSADFLQFLSLGHSIFLQQPHWYKNIFGEISLISPWFALFPLAFF